MPLMLLFFRLNVVNASIFQVERCLNGFFVRLNAVNAAFLFRLNAPTSPFYRLDAAIFPG